MKRMICLLMVLSAARLAISQEKDHFTDSAAIYFREIKEVEDQLQAIWNKPLYGPLLLVDPDTRRMYLNYPDTALRLQAAGDIYTGILPTTDNIANTAVNLGSHRWAMVMLPLPGNKQDRINLLAHELFHSVQPSLGFRFQQADNNHLDEKDGRIYLRLELAALKSALQATDTADMKKCLAHAMAFRRYRHQLYPGADTTENILELNEGLAEYTGMISSGRDEKQFLAHFEKGLERFLSNPTFVRSFAYQTIPIYGYLLHRTYPTWNQHITAQTNLTAYFSGQFPLLLPRPLEQGVVRYARLYNGETVTREETARDVQKKVLVARYKKKFIDDPHLEIGFVKMSVSFDPRSIQPLEDKGTVYPAIRVTDEWGILDVKQGALMSPGWDKITVSLPVSNVDTNVYGDGWTLTLNKGWQVLKDPSGKGNYKLVKQ